MRYAPILLVSRRGRVPDYPQVSSGNETNPTYQLTTPQARCGAIGLYDGLPQDGMILLGSERGIPFVLALEHAAPCSTPCDSGGDSPLQKIVHIRLPFPELRGNRALRLPDK